jgi:predicted transcriptional regulator
MQILWKLESAFVKDIVEQMPEPKPAYNTISTIVRILETKGFVDHKAYGKTHEYFPVISKDKYTKFYLNNLLKGYFNGSFQNLVSFFAKENKMEVKDIEKLLQEIKNKKL